MKSQNGQLRLTPILQGQPTLRGHSHSGAGQGVPPLEPSNVNGDGEKT
jgi:hypothetical protein